MSEGRSRKVSFVERYWPLTWRGFLIAFIGLGFLAISYRLSPVHRYPLLDAVYAKFLRYGPWGDQILRVSALVCAVLTSVSVVLVSLSRMIVCAGLRRATQTRTELRCADALSPRPTGYSLACFKWLFFVTVKPAWNIPEVDSARVSMSASGEERVAPARRGLAMSITRTYTIGDLLGLASMTVISTETHPAGRAFCIMPALSSRQSALRLRPAQSAGDSSSASGRPEGDRIDIMQYQHGDARHMIWKIVARTGGMQKYVRAPETVSDKRSALFLVAGDNDEASVELVSGIIREKVFGTNWVLGTNTANTTVSADMMKAQWLLAETGMAKREDTLKKTRSLFDTFQSQMLRCQVETCRLFLPRDEDIVKELFRGGLRMRCDVFIGCREADLESTKEFANGFGDLCRPRQDLKLIIMQPND